MEVLLSITIIALVGTITPGPNNIIVMTIAARSGLQHALKAISAVIAGSMLVILLVWAGLGLIINQRPVIQTAILLAGLAYLFWMGLNLIASAITSKTQDYGETENGPRAKTLPDSFVGISLFQLLNPKAWVFMTSMAAALSQEFGSLAAMGIQAGILAPVSLLNLGLWAVLGHGFSDRLEHQSFKCRFDILMGLLLALPAGYMAIGVITTSVP